MAKIRLNLSGLSTAQKLAKAEQVVPAMTGNPTYPTPTPTLASISTAATELRTADAESVAARQTAKEKTAIKNQKEEKLEQLLTQLAAHVESVAGGDEQKILSAGFDVRTVGVVTTETPDAPQGLTATVGDHEGEIDLSWDTVPGAKSYVIGQSADSGTPVTWSHAAVSTRSSYTANGLTSGTRYWFRVAAVNNNGQSGWSDPSMKIAP